MVRVALCGPPAEGENVTVNEQVYNTTSALLSGWSNIATISPIPIIGVAPTSLAFGTVPWAAVRLLRPW